MIGQSALKWTYLYLWASLTIMKTSQDPEKMDALVEFLLKLLFSSSYIW